MIIEMANVWWYILQVFTVFFCVSINFFWEKGKKKKWDEYDIICLLSTSVVPF